MPVELRWRDPHRPLFRNWKKPIMYVIVILLLIFLYASGIMESFILSLHQFKYAGAFAAGLFYSYGMTTPFAIAVLAIMAQNANPFLLAFFGALGAVASDLLLLRAFSAGAGKEIRITGDFSFKVPELKSLPPALSPRLRALCALSFASSLAKTHYIFKTANRYECVDLLL